MSSSSVLRPVLALLAWLGLSFVASGIGAAASIRAASFYGQLLQPSWAPPPWLFGPVWTTLYAMMGVAAWLVWRADGGLVRRWALALFLIQLAVNAAWSWVFFAWRLGGLAFIHVALLLVLIAVTLVAFWRVRPLAGAMLLPYLAWVSFATALNFSLWQLNPGTLGLGLLP